MCQFDNLIEFCYDIHEISKEWCNSAAHYIKKIKSRKKDALVASFFIVMIIIKIEIYKGIVFSLN